MIDSNLPIVRDPPKRKALEKLSTMSSYALYPQPSEWLDIVLVKVK